MILAKTSDWVALDKPAGVSLATSTRPGKSGAEAIRRLLEACGEEDQEDLRLVHRLDQGTSGVVLLARTDAAHRELSRAFQSGQAHKTYRALVWGHPRPPHSTIEAPLGRDLHDGRKMRVRDDGKPAVTRYQTLARWPSVADLALFPKTGRTHQIRVHLAFRGHPIVGDDLYGGATRWHGVRDRVLQRELAAVDRPLLHAERLEIEDLGITVAAPLPEDFQRLLARFASDVPADPRRR